MASLHGHCSVTRGKGRVGNVKQVGFELRPEDRVRKVRK